MNKLEEQICEYFGVSYEYLLRIKKEVDEDKEYYFEIIFIAWNSCNIIKHRKITSEIKRAIKKCYRDGLTINDITEAIALYHDILKNENTLLSVKWTLWDFLKYHIHKFLDYKIAYENYKKHTQEQEGKNYKVEWKEYE